MTAASASGGAYEGGGRRIAASLRQHSSILVTSDDASAAAHAAIGIALGESAHRLVMIGDLAGEAPPLQTLVRDDDPHGIYDCFEFGTSFTRIAREVDGAKNIFIMPSGTESAAIERIISSPRWKGFAAEFASSDELLLLVARSDAPGIAELVSRIDGVVLVGIPQIDSAPNANIVAKVAHPAHMPPLRVDRAPKRNELPPWKLAVAATGLLAAGVAGGALYASRVENGAALAAVAAHARPNADSALPAQLAVVAANPEDSANATLYSIQILASNTAEGANFEINRHGAQMPGATISLVPIGDTEATWYKVHAGAYADSAQAEALLATLRRQRIVSDSAGVVVRAPLALFVDSVSAQAGMTARIREKLKELSGRGVHAYALMQGDGTARIYAGAFERPQQSSLAATALRVAGLTPVLEYRKGRLQ